MTNAKKILAITLSTLALTACDLDTVDPVTDSTDPESVDPGTGQEFPTTGYTKVGNDGIILADQTQAWDDNGSEAEGTQWSCVRDNDTGLYWEVKTNDDGLRDKDWNYTWYDTNPATNGGEAGIGDTGLGTITGFENEELNDALNVLLNNSPDILLATDDCYDKARCDTEKYTEDVGATQLCGFNDWRLPSVAELSNIVSPDSTYPTIDANYFPNTSLSYWSSSSIADANDAALYVNFFSGNVGGGSKASSADVRLVRASQSL